MIYYDDGRIIIRTMNQEDVSVIFFEEKAQGWHPNIKIYENYFSEQRCHNRYVFIAEYEGKVSGYTTLLPSAMDGPFVNKGIPEVVNFGVFIKYQNKGIGNKILDVAESIAAQLSDTICLGVGVHSGYGSAQRIYIKRGYLFDGSGVWYKGRQLDPYVDCCNDDDLVLFMSKPLR